MTNFSYATDDPSRLTREWEALLCDFRALGGVAENVVLGEGSFGLGLFPRDATKPFLLRLPDNLLFPVEDVEFVQDRVRVRDSAAIAPAERDFFERYQSIFSWGGGGGAESARFISMLDSLPPEVRTRLINNYRMRDVLEGDQAKRTQTRFLKSRMTYWKNRYVLIPLIDLANCGSEGIFYSGDSEGHLQIEGEVPGEILVDYGPHDSLSIFHFFGFPAARPRAYSLPMRTKIGKTTLKIGWNLAAKRMRANISVPEMKLEGGEIFLSHLVIGNANGPRLPRGIFCALMKEARATGADEAFDRIVLNNKRAFLDLLGALEPHRGEMVAMLRATAHFQLKSMTQCIGALDL